jgi:GntR family transcriptional regulator/MocR family aminotransferase
MNRTSLTPELLLALVRGGRVPLRAQLESQLREAITAGRLAGGARLPSSRALAGDLGVSRGVVVEAYAQLVAEGYLAVRRGAAPTVRAGGDRTVATIAPAGSTAAPAFDPRMPAGMRFDLRPGTPDLALFPRRAWAAAQRRALEDTAHGDLGYPDPAGHPRLREALAEYLGRVRGVDADADRVVVCGGVAEVLALIARVLRRRGASRLGVESPSHRATRALLEHHGMRTVPIPVDAEGIDVDALAAAAPAAVVVTPAHQFPTGAVLSPARRAALVDWARRTGGLIVEDDYDAEYRFDRAPVGAVQGLAPGHVVHAHSVSKTLAPGLRLGWAVVPPRLVGDLVTEKRMSDLGAPVLEQLTLAAFITRGELDRHLRHTRPVYRRRRDELRRGLPELEVAGAAAGLHMLLRLPAGLREEAVAAAAAQHGVAVEPLGPHAVAPRPPALLLGYGRIAEPAIAAGVAQLAAAVGYVA